MRGSAGKNPTNSIVFSQGARIGIYCFGLNSKIWKLVNTRGVVKQSGRDGSVLNRSPQWSFYANRIRSDESHCKPGCSQLDVEDALSDVFESNAAGVTNFSIVGRTLRSDKCRRSKRGSTKCGNCEEGKKLGIKTILRRSR